MVKMVMVEMVEMMVMVKMVVVEVVIEMVVMVLVIVAPLWPTRVGERRGQESVFAYSVFCSI